jgi:dTDP-4-dehydrorhamnose 3,5-epimerase/CDP-3, 6-dideoxy-D-glycero-D-glycero-4-hexulose-5-epimerase
MEIVSQHISGVLLLKAPVHKDERGSLLKNFSRDNFHKRGIHFEPAEQFFTISAINVIRGMHYQVDTYAHDKVVCCLAGQALDVVVDIRPKSPTYKKLFAIQLKSCDGLSLFIPKGYAHGFLSLEENTVISYLTTTMHSPDHDHGINWSSIDYCWPTSNPITSLRDQKLPSIGNHI